METDFQTKIAANIRKLLNDKGISQAELSRRTELDTASISKIFSGQRGINLNDLSDISTAALHFQLRSSPE